MRPMISNKHIYTHDFVVACYLDGNLYHAKCFNLTNDMALEIQSLNNDWVCPDCQSNIFPSFNEDYVNNITVTCHVCLKIISNTRHEIVTCNSCDSICHKMCTLEYICTLCITDDDCSIQSPHFNPYDFGDCDDNDLYDDNSELHIESINIASSILEDCNYVDPPMFQTKFKSCLNSSYTTIYCQNINGMKTNFDETAIHLSSIQCDFDIICFTETNISEDELDQFSINRDYNKEILPKNPSKQKGSGILLYYKNCLNFTKVDSLCMHNPNFEILGGKLKIDIGFIYVIVIYRIHNSNPNDFRNNIEKILESLTSPCIVLGDFNHNCFLYNRENLTENTVTEKYINMFMSNGFSPLISKGTRFDNKKNNTITCIDQIWCNMITSKIKSGVFINTASDHQPIFTILPSNSCSLYDSSDDSENIFMNKKYNITSKTTGLFSNKIGQLINELNCSMDDNTVSQNFSTFHSKLLHIQNC